MAGSPKAFSSSAFQNSAFQTGLAALLEALLKVFGFKHKKQTNMVLTDSEGMGFEHRKQTSISLPEGSSYIFKKRGRK